VSDKGSALWASGSVEISCDTELWNLDHTIDNILLFEDKNIFDIYVTEYGTALTTILPILFLYSNTVIVIAGTFEP
jgi:hypothetical protein